MGDYAFGGDQALSPVCFFSVWDVEKIVKHRAWVG